MGRTSRSVFVLAFGVLVAGIAPAARAVGQDKANGSDAAKKEVAGLQGTWQCRGSESNGKDDGADGARAWTLAFGKEKAVYKRNGEAFAEGDLVVDPEKAPKHLTLSFPAKGQTDVMIFLRVGDVLILCGHRDGKTRPAQFETGTEQGGAFLSVWERVK